MQTKFNSKSIHSKSGKTCTLRQADIDDAAAFVDFINSNIQNSSTIPLVAGEYVHDEMSQKEVILQFADSDNCLLLLVEHEGKIIGNIDLTGHTRKRLYHTGVIGMGILEAWRNQGLGSEMLAAVISWASESSPIELIWLNVYASNTLGLGLYKKMGFIESGKIPKFFKHGESYLDNITMYLSLDKE